MKRRFLALVLAGCLAAVLSTAAWATLPTGFYLNVELPSGETIALDVESGDSIDNVKQKVQNAAGVSVTEQYLYYGGKFLNNGRTLADYNIQKESTLLVASEEKGVPNGVRLTEESATGIAIELTEKTTLTAGEYYLCNNVNLTQTLVIRGNVTLDLNGFVLKITGSGSVIKIESGSLTLVDSHPAAIHKFVKNTDDLWMLDESQGAGIVRGGIITGGNAGDNDGGGVYVCPGAELVMRGGSIVGCKAQQGGGVYVADKNEAKTLGRFTMEGGSIVGCVATDESYSGGGEAGTYILQGMAFKRRRRCGQPRRLHHDRRHHSQLHRHRRTWRRHLQRPAAAHQRQRRRHRLQSRGQLCFLGRDAYFTGFNIHRHHRRRHLRRKCSKQQEYHHHRRYLQR